MQELDRILPEETKARGMRWGNELVLPYSEALTAIGIASERGIAILGLEAFEVTKEGLLTVDMASASAYVPFRGEWEAYVRQLNAEAERWITAHRFGEGHGYILSSASQSEFASLRPPQGG